MSHTIRRVPLDHYIHIPQGTFKTPEELYKFMFPSHRERYCYEFVNNVYKQQQGHDIYLLNNNGYEYSFCKPYGNYKQFFIDSLGEL